MIDNLTKPTRSSVLAPECGETDKGIFGKLSTNH